MEINKLHSWKLTYKEAVAVQESLKKRIKTTKSLKKIHFIAGADVSYSKTTNKGYAAVILFRYPDLKMIEASYAKAALQFPYIPGLLSFREIPILAKAFERLNGTPDIIICDGQGIAHPRRIGLASHLGLVTNIPTIGCAKSRLIGSHRKLGTKKGSYATLKIGAEKVGVVLRSKDNVKPLYVSPGHKIDVHSAHRIVLSFCNGYRIPEPTRQAHILVNKLRLEDKKQSSQTQSKD